MKANFSTRSGRPLVARRRMDGVVMIEVLVALLIFMFGVLGLVGLQASVTRAQTDSKFRADASYLATDMVGRLWSDLGNVANYDSSNCASTLLCAEWQSKVAAGLPKGKGAVTIVANSADASNTATINVSWAGPDGQTHTFVTNTTIVKACPKCP